MMTKDDIAEVLMSDFMECTGIPSATTETDVTDDSEADGLGSELIAVHVKKQDSDIYWKDCFAEVNLCVPDFRSGKRNIPRLRALEGLVRDFLKTSVVGEHNSISYQYSVSSIDILREEKLKCHYVNVRVLFEVYNII